VSEKGREETKRRMVRERRRVLGGKVRKRKKLFL